LSTKKDKLLESAQRFIAKGQLDRAIKEYEQIVALESGDIRLRQKLAELLVRVNRKEEAIAEYEVLLPCGASGWALPVNILRISKEADCFEYKKGQIS